MPPPAILQEDSWSSLVGRIILPILVRCAEEGEKITYGDLAKLVERKIKQNVWPRTLNNPLGVVGDALEETADVKEIEIPPINVIAINKESGLPSYGVDAYLRHYARSALGKRLNKPERQAIIEEVQESVYHFKQWHQILEDYGLKKYTGRLPKTKKRSGSSGKRYGKQFSNEGESPEHRALKRFIKYHPEAIGLAKSIAPGSDEYEFFSGDRVDVLFDNGRERIAVEVKSRKSNPDDLHRGIFQCIKYRALVRAELRDEGRIPNGSAVLVCEQKLPNPLRNKAKTFGIAVFDRVQPR